LDAGFVSSYPTSATTWYDLSYSGNNGTLTNGPTFSSLSGGSIVFDGTDDYVLTPIINHNIGTGNFSYSAWVYPIRLKGGGATISSFIGNGDYSPTFGFDLNNYPNQLGYYWNGWKGFGSNPTLYQWNHVTMTRIGTLVIGFLNGVACPITYTDTQSMSNSVNVMGRSGVTYGPDTFKGNISSAQIYNKSLSPFEVYQNYNSMKGRFGIPDIVTSGLTLNLDAGNPYSYNPLNTGSTTWTDISGNGKNGTLTNGTYYSGGTIVFDGTNDYVSLSTSGLISGWSALTYNVWVNVSQNPSYIFPGFISTYTTAVALNTSVGSWETGRGLWYEVDTVNGNYESGSPGLNTFSLNTWFNVCMVYDGTNVYAYYNNSLDKQFSASGVLKTISDIRIGNTFQYGFLNGKIAVAQIYNRALSASEVQQNFNALRGRYGI
jgi:hypothetical protein